MKHKKEEVVEKPDVEKKSRRRKKQLKKKKREERLAGLILLIVTIFIGFVLWVSGEVRENKLEDKVNENWQTIPNQNSSDVMIIK